MLPCVRAWRGRLAKSVRILLLDDTFYFTSSYDYNCLQSPVSRFVVVHEGKKQEKMAVRQHQWARSRMKIYYKYIFFYKYWFCGIYANLCHMSYYVSVFVLVQKIMNIWILNLCSPKPESNIFFISAKISISMGL